jgi:hypothetical protein
MSDDPRVQQLLDELIDERTPEEVCAPDALARLPDEERKQWERFWSDVDALLRRVNQPA